MDIELRKSDTDGIEAAKEIRRKTDAKIMFLTSREDPKTLDDAITKAFASGYIFKSQHQTYTDEIYYAATSSTTPQKELIKKIVLSQLTHAERAVLIGILEKKIIGNAYIASEGSSPKTIACQKSSIFRKLGLTSEKELIKVFNNW